MPVVSSGTAGSGEAPKQFTQPSRKGKKAWRKNVDLTEVEAGLVQLNEEIIRGGVIREKPSEALFTIDVKGDTSKLSQKAKAAKKTLRADDIINNRSAVPAVSMRKRPSGGDDGKTTDGIIAPKRLRQDWVSHKELARLRKVADGRDGESTLAVRDATYDVWGDDDASAASAAAAVVVAATDDATDHIDKRQEPKVPKSMRRQPISLLANGKHAPAVPKPTGGYSYNPVFADYEGRLADESSKAISTEKKRLEDEAASAEKQAAAARSGAEADAAEERANMSEWEEDSEWEGFQSGREDGDDKSITTKKQPKRKTQAQRNRILRRKEEERLAKHKADMKARRAQEQRIKEIAQEVADRDAQRALILAGDGAEADSDSDADDADRGDKLRRKQLGKYKLPERDLELVLPDELQDSLRLLKPEGNLLRDRYRSMLVRGKLESRRHIPFKKQARRKDTEKWTHKDFVL